MYRYSARMRIDLEINVMTYSSWKTGELPLMRDGTQWRPMVHVRDTSRAQMFMLTADHDAINGQIFNVGSDDNNYQIGPLAEQVISVLPGEVAIEWYGDPDVRSYRVSFSKIEKLGFEAQFRAEDGARDVMEALEQGLTDRTTKTLTLDWYKALTYWQSVLDGMTLHGGLIELPGEQP